MIQAEIFPEGDETIPRPPSINLSTARAAKRLFVDQYLLLGPIFRMPRLGETLTVLTGPEANIFFARHGGTLLNFQKVWDDIDRVSGAVKLTRDGEAHRRFRASMGHGFSRATALEHLPLMISITQELISSWQDGMKTALVPLIRRLVMEQLSRILLRYTPGEDFASMDQFLTTWLGVVMNRSMHASALDAPEFVRNRDRIHEIAWQIVTSHQMSPPNARKMDLIDLALHVMSQEPDLMGIEDIVHIAITALVSGLDTAAHTIAFMLYALLKHPNLYQHVQHEIDTFFVQGIFDWAHLKEMPTLHGTALETLRFYPVLGSQRCHAARSFTFAGYRVTEGETLLLHTAGAHFLPSLYRDPECFDPDRFSPPRAEHRQPGAFAPFGLGEHQCPGAGLAEVLILMIVSTLLHHFQLTLDPPDYEAPLVMKGAPSPGQKFVAQVQKRH